MFPRWTFLVLGGVTTACAQPRDADREPVSGCAVQVIVTLQRAPDAALVGELARASGARLELVRTMTSSLHLFELRAAGAEPECAAAVERLRSDPRVRAVDLDQRRGIQSP
jgi:hypothetical protein